MTKMKKKNSEYFLSGVIFITIIILSLFNRFKIDDYVNPDAEVECVFARAIWNEKTLFPAEWIHSTEPQNLKPSILTSIFWGKTQIFCQLDSNK